MEFVQKKHFFFHFLSSAGPGLGLGTRSRDRLNPNVKNPRSRLNPKVAKNAKNGFWVISARRKKFRGEPAQPKFWKKTELSRLNSKFWEKNWVEPAPPKFLEQNLRWTANESLFGTIKSPLPNPSFPFEYSEYVSQKRNESIDNNQYFTNVT